MRYYFKYIHSFVREYQFTLTFGYVWVCVFGYDFYTDYFFLAYAPLLYNGWKIRKKIVFWIKIFFFRFLCITIALWVSLSFVFESRDLQTFEYYILRDIFLDLFYLYAVNTVYVLLDLKRCIALWGQRLNNLITGMNWIINLWFYIL